MASLENRTGYFNVVFRFGGKKYTRSLHTDDEKEANRLLANLEQTVRDVKSGRISLPPDADIPTFLLSDGKLTTPHVSNSDSISEIQLSLRDLFESFFVSLPDDSLEESTVSLMKMHRNNLLRILGDNVFIEDIDLNTLDIYSKTRRKDKGRRKGKISANTIKKELVTLRHVLQWGKKRGKLASDIPEIREVQDPSNRTQGRAITRDVAHNRFKSVLKDSKWNVIPGWHCLRHSFISNLASHSIDQRLIDEFVGHTTEEMRRRYRHLFPDVKQEAISSVFG